MEGKMYIVMPDGTIVWEPTPEDIEAWLEEVRDLEPDPEDFD